MKRIISSNNIPLILNGKYAWEIIIEPYTDRELYKLILGIGIDFKSLEVLYGKNEGNIVIQQVPSGVYETDSERWTVFIEIPFDKTENIITGLLKGHNLELLPLYNSDSYLDGKNQL